MKKFAIDAPTTLRFLSRWIGRTALGPRCLDQAMKSARRIPEVMKSYGSHNEPPGWVNLIPIHAIRGMNDTQRLLWHYSMDENYRPLPEDTGMWWTSRPQEDTLVNAWIYILSSHKAYLTVTHRCSRHLEGPSIPDDWVAWEEQGN